MDSPLQQLSDMLGNKGGFVRLATQAEIEAMEFSMMRKTDFENAQVTGILYNWFLVMIKPNGASPSLPHLMGNLAGTTKMRVTGVVVELNLTQGYARVNHEDSEIYELGSRAHEAPGMIHVTGIAHAVANWMRL